MVAVLVQFVSVQCFEVTLFGIDLLEQGISIHGHIVELAVLLRVVVRNHVEVEEELDLAQRHDRMFHVPVRTSQIRILARESDEVHIEFRLVLRIMGRKGDDGSRTRCIVVSTRIVGLLTQFAQVVVVGGKHVATVVSVAFHLRNHVEAFVVLQELVLYIHLDGLRILREVRLHPEDRLFSHHLAVSLVELQRFFPSVDHTRIAAFLLARQFAESLRMLVGEHEIANHHGTLVLRSGKVGQHLFLVEVLHVHVVQLEFALQSRVELSQGEVHTRSQFLAVHAYVHLARESVDVQFERLASHLVYARLGKFLGNPFASLVGSVFRISAALVFGGTQFLYDFLVVCQILSIQLYRDDSQNQ